MTSEEMNIMNEKAILSTPLYFNIGRDSNGRVGVPKYVNEISFAELVERCLRYENVYIENHDENGRFCKPFLKKCSNCERITDDDLRGTFGVLDFDGEYNTDVVISLGDAIGRDGYEKALVKAYKRNELRDDISEYLIEQGVIEK